MLSHKNQSSIAAISCTEAEDLLMSYLDGLLSGAEEACLRAHLDSCQQCRRMQEEMELMTAALRTLPRAMPVPAGFTRAVLAQIQEQPTAVDSVSAGGRRGLKQWLRNWQLKVAAAAAALMLVAGSWASGYMGKLAGRSTGPAQVAVNSGGSEVTELAQAGSPPTAEKIGADIGSAGESGGTGSVAGSNNNGQGTNNSLPETGKGENSISGSGIQAQQGTGSGSLVVKGGSVQPGGSGGQEADGGKYVFLDSQLRIYSSLVRATTDNLSQTLAGLKHEAEKMGGRVTLADQRLINGVPTAVVRLTLPRQQADTLLANLPALGIYEYAERRENSVQDVTAAYNEAVKRWQELRARLATADPTERQALSYEIEALEKQLNSWQTEGGQKVVVFILEQR